jgi:hypothetical protein
MRDGGAEEGINIEAEEGLHIHLQLHAFDDGRVQLQRLLVNSENAQG